MIKATLLMGFFIASTAFAKDGARTPQQVGTGDIKFAIKVNTADVIFNSRTALAKKTKISLTQFIDQIFKRDSSGMVLSENGFFEANVKIKCSGRILNPDANFVTEAPKISETVCVINQDQ